MVFLCRVWSLFSMLYLTSAFVVIFGVAFGAVFGITTADMFTVIFCCSTMPSTCPGNRLFRRYSLSRVIEFVAICYVINLLTLMLRDSHYISHYNHVLVKDKHREIRDQHIEEGVEAEE